MMKDKKGSVNWAGVLVVIFLGIIATVVLLGAFGVLSFGKLSSLGGDKQGEYDYTGSIVERQLSATNKYTAAAIDPTYYIYDEKPANWGNGRVSVEDGYVSTASSSSGVATMQEEPGKYFVRCVLSGYYDTFKEVEIPSSGDVPLSDYNQAEGIEKFQMIDVETLAVSNVDMGITTNETSDKTYHVFANFNVDDNEGYCLNEVKLREDATYSFATDTDGDGIYDEGINKIKLSIAGKTVTPFDVAGSVDEFSGDDEYVISVGEKMFEENSVVSAKFEVTCDATLDTTGDADEKCGNGEDFLDDIIFVDCAGNTATFHLVG